MLLRQKILKKVDFKATISALSQFEARIDEIRATMAIYESQLKGVEESKVEVVELNKVKENLKTQITSQFQALSAYESRLKSVDDSTTDVVNFIKTFGTLQEQANFLA